MQANSRVCPNNTDARGRPTNVFCAEFMRQMTAEHDLIIVNGGHAYGRPAEYEADVRKLLAVMQTGARARPGSLYFFAQTPAQHFHGRGKSGLYEERAEVKPAQCFCGPTDANRPDWRNTKLAALLPAFDAVRPFPFWELTQPTWHMHLANTRTRTNESEATCDCTHFCCAHPATRPTPPTCPIATAAAFRPGRHPPQSCGSGGPPSDVAMRQWWARGGPDCRHLRTDRPAHPATQTLRPSGVATSSPRSPPP